MTRDPNSRVMIRAFLNDESPLAVGVEIMDIDTGSVMVVRVLREFINERGHKVGDTLSDAEAEEIVDASRVCECAEAGLRLLVYTDNSKRGLERKLRAKGYDRDVSECASEALAKMGYINESSQIERRGRVLAERKLRGKRRIAADLGAIGYDRDAVSDWLRDCGIDFGEICARSIEKKGGLPPREDKDGRRRLISYLYRQGFTGEDIRAAARILNEKE